MIRLRDVSFRYGDGAADGGGGASGGAALRRISFDVPQGGFRWLLGPSGAGKSSLLRLLSLGARPTSGGMDILGSAIEHARRATLARLRQRIGIVHQDFRLLPDLPVFDNVALPLRLQHRPEDEIRDEVEAILSWVGLGARAASRPPQLSGGEQQRVAIARAVIHRPALILADEPTNALDDAQASRLMELFQDLSGLGTTIVVATHNDALIRRYPAHELELAQGRLARDG
ncbi:ABC transporter related [Gluconacetobacter diazotrophicus PA1 5]|uniref:ABC transporter protein n=1 Tax=Gluconacetobacter diazotrophicus (strain ATCC 49037 / DSM 5601 / CCUG 37298 / CIP 103539 / LMG 7603 / PAl5) TaxID=272568 RepID=A9H1D0_GLUDA|nr:ATP-binding cassette domain-containing protein [Gluconacetobacter diazotrophicus]ACI52802.1 ABC transporter related [Gluconacetobacter diazotrophicus PA1 5]TWB09053.1 cell division transport system ATP-binding protein [Gluconacetobacter diazotrophicus]CAP57238.1 ABC transporter protein [Gluconacetobacter diazotrophicus PA1 5]